MRTPGLCYNNATSSIAVSGQVRSVKKGHHPRKWCPQIPSSIQPAPGSPLWLSAFPFGTTGSAVLPARSGGTTTAGRAVHQRDLLIPPRSRLAPTIRAKPVPAVTNGCRNYVSACRAEHWNLESRPAWRTPAGMSADHALHGVGITFLEAELVHLQASTYVQAQFLRCRAVSNTQKRSKGRFGSASQGFTATGASSSTRCTRRR